MSKTERALSSDAAGDALEELFDDDEFDGSHDDAIEHADRDLDESNPVSIIGEPLLRFDDVVDEDRVDEDLEHEISDGDFPDVVSVTHHQLDDDPDVGPDGSGGVTARIDEREPDETDLDDADLDDADLDDADLDDADLDDAVSVDILDELRRADIDGPVVGLVPQDETNSGRRRPRRAADYDPAPVPIPAKVPRVLGRKPRVRKVTRVVRHVDPWSVFKIAVVANLVLYVIILTASVLLWNVANATGTVENVERFFESFGWNTFEFNGGEMYHAGWIAGLFVVIGFTGLAVLVATLFNLITDLVGGIRFTVLEEEVVETRTSPMRRFVVRRPEPEIPAVLHDGSGSMIREAVVDDTGANTMPTR